MMGYEVVGDVFSGELPDGEITHDEDEFFDAWAPDDIDDFEEDW